MYLLDTDMIIYCLKNVELVVRNFREHRRARMSLSVITYGELVYGAENSQQRNQNLSRVHRVAEIYPVLPVTCAVMETFGDLKADLRRQGRTVDDFDLVIAATALSHAQTLVTNNTLHFEGIPGLKLENWAAI
jgi:predicted nucleic acid-binding protein